MKLVFYSSWWSLFNSSANWKRKFFRDMFTPWFLCTISRHWWLPNLKTIIKHVKRLSTRSCLHGIFFIVSIFISLSFSISEIIRILFLLRYVFCDNFYSHCCQNLQFRWYCQILPRFHIIRLYQNPIQIDFHFMLVIFFILLIILFINYLLKIRP